MYSQCALQNDRLCTVAVHLNNILCLYGQEYFYVRHFLVSDANIETKFLFRILFWPLLRKHKFLQCFVKHEQQVPWIALVPAGNVGPFTAVVGAPGANRSIVLEGGHLRARETALEHFHISLGSPSRLLLYAHVPGIFVCSGCACSSCIWPFHQFHFEPIISFTATD